MKRIYILLFTMLFLPSLVFGKVDESQMMKGAKLSESQPELPTISIGANTVIGSVAQSGWPIIISAAMSSEEDPTPDVPDNLRVKFIDSKDKAVPVNFEPVKRQDKSQRFWIALEQGTQELTPGHYTITFEPVDNFNIEPGELTVESKSDKASSSLALLKTQVLLLTGKDKEAMGQADELIAKDPNNLDAWIAKGDMLMSQDLPDEASRAYEKAMELQAQSGQESIFLQERMRRAFFRSLEKRGVISNTDQQP